MSKNSTKIKKIYQLLFLIVLIFFVGGLAGVIGERFIMPWLGAFPSLEKYDFIKRANDKVTIIKQTKEISVKEDFSVANIAEKVSPSVVSIIRFKEEAEGELNTNLIRSSKDIQNNIKTGLILTNDGLIVSILDELTEEIVKSNEKLKEGEMSSWKFKVLAGENKEFDAEILDIDEFSRLVFYKVDRNDLPVPSLGDSSKVEIGEKVVICGNTGGEYQKTFSAGLIKEKDNTFTLLNSELSSSENLEGAILIDAQIDEKSIGGPVVDYSGSVVGIVNQIEKDGKRIGFSVPIDDIKPIVGKVMKGEKIERPFLGIYYLSINREIALLNNLEVDQGALVYSFSGQQGLAIIKNSPADKAGIEIEDIIVAVNDRKVNLENPLSKLVADYLPGDEIELDLIRNNKKEKIKVILE
jgi:serine protease Do